MLSKLHTKTNDKAALRMTRWTMILAQFGQNFVIKFTERTFVIKFTERTFVIKFKVAN